MEKLVLALVHAARRLRRYFQGHAIKGIIDKPIIQILNNLEATRRLTKWGIELEAYGIKYASRSAIKGQVLANFLADTMAEDSSAQIKSSGPNNALVEGKSREEQEALEAKTYENLGTKIDIWKLYTDGASNEHGSVAGLRIAAKMKVEKMKVKNFAFDNIVKNVTTPTLLWRNISGLKKKKLENVVRCITAIVYNDAFTSEVTLSCEPTVSPLNDNKIDFRISFDESDDEDYTPEVSYSNDLDFFKDFENEFPAIVYNAALTSKSNFLTEPTVSIQHIDEFNLKDETSLSECDEKEQNVLNFNDLFPFNVIYPNYLKSDKDNRLKYRILTTLRGIICH
ncbi:hypothetical protein Tco_1457749 [Tanacetum coccineum]